MKEFKLDKIKATGTTVGDVHFPKVKLLLPFDGSNGATSTTDSSNSNNSVTFVGTSQISTAQSKFGGSSMLFDGDSDYLTVTNSELDLDGATCTIEFWAYLLGGIGSHICFYSDYNGASSGISIEKNSDNVVKVNISGDGADITGTTTLSTGQWYHIALSGDDGSYKLFLNGTQEGSTFTGSSTNGTTNKYIGTFYWSGLGGAVRLWNGYIEDFRITKGLARYTSNFTPPTSAHLTSAGDANKQIIVNSSADGVDVGTGGINQARISKAWVNFNGSGTVAIRDSYNVSSITDNGTGDYSVVFSTAMTNANYCMNMNSGDKASTWGIPIYDGVSNYTTSLCRFLTQGPDDSPNDNVIVCASFFGN